MTSRREDWVTRLGAVLRALGVCAALSCGTSIKDARIEITGPADGQVLTLADDVGRVKPGLQVPVTARAFDVGVGTEVVLQVDGQSKAETSELARVARDGSIRFEQPTLPPGTHALSVSTKSGGVRSSASFSYTYRAIEIDEPRAGDVLGPLNDADASASGFQVDVSATTYDIDRTQPAALWIDHRAVGTAQQPDVDGMVAFKGVTLSEGDHVLQVVSGNIESASIQVSFNANCPSMSFVSPAVPSGDVLTLGGVDACPSTGQAFETSIELVTDAALVELFVNGTLFASAVPQGQRVRFEHVVLDRFNSPNDVSVRLRDEQGFACKQVSYPAGITVACSGVDCSLEAPNSVVGADASGQQVQYLNAAARGADGFAFVVHTDTAAIGEPVTLLVDGAERGAEQPSGAESGVTATFDVSELAEGAHTLQARCEHADGVQGASRVVTWVVDTSACGVSIARPAPNTVVASETVPIEASWVGDDCSGVRAASCDPAQGIAADLSFTPLNGAQPPFVGEAALADDVEQQLCVEVQDHAGNVGRASVPLEVHKNLPRLAFETLQDGDKFNAAGGSGYRADADPNTDVCEVDIDVACQDLGADVLLRRGDENGRAIATATCAERAGGDPPLLAGYAGRARFAKVVISEALQLTATQRVAGETLHSTTIGLQGDCEAPELEFVGDPCEGGQIAAQAGSELTRAVAVSTNSADAPTATLTVIEGANEVFTQQGMLASGRYNFAGVALGAAASDARALQIAVTAQDAFDNIGEVACTTELASGLPGLALTRPAADAVILSGTAPELCNWAPNSVGVTAQGSVDRATQRSLSAAVNGATPVPVTLTGTAFSVCLPVQPGDNTLEFRLLDTQTTAVRRLTRHMQYLPADPAAGPGIAITSVTLPSDRTGLATLAWTAPSAQYTGQFQRYVLRCSPTALDVATASVAEQNAWWAAARELALPGGLVPPAATAQIALRVGENNSCVLRAADAADRWTPLTSSQQLQLPFKVKRFTGASASGFDFAPVGDVNGDGLDDLVVGGRTRAYLLFGSATGWAASTPEVTFIGDSASPYFGAKVAGLGDFNGDGLGDFAIADQDWNNAAGRVLVYYGRAAADGWPSRVDASGASCPADLCLQAATAGQRLGYALAAAGHFDADERPDLAISEPLYPNGTGSGRVFVVLGKNYESGTARAGTFFGRAQSIEAAQGFVVSGDSSQVSFGQSLAGVGAVDGATGEDLVLSAMGKAYVLSGRNYAWAQSTGLTSLTVAALGARANDGVAGGSGLPFDTGDAYFARAAFAIGNVVEVASAQRPGIGDLALWRSGGSEIAIYAGDTSFALADRFSVSSAARSSVSASVAGADLDGDGLSDLLVALDTRTGVAAAGVRTPVRLWYGDVIARARAARVAIDDNNASSLDPAADPALNWRGVKLAGDLNGDGELDLAFGATNADDTQPSGEFSILY